MRVKFFIGNYLYQEMGVLFFTNKIFYQEMGPVNNNQFLIGCKAVREEVEILDDLAEILERASAQIK